MARRWHVAFGVAILILASTTAIYYGRQTGPVNLARPLAELPVQIEGWIGTPTDRQVSPFHLVRVDNELIRLYRNPSGETFGLYIAHFCNQVGQKKLVDFRSHALAQNAESVTLLPSGISPSHRINRTLLSGNGERWIAYYWFDINGRIVASRYLAKLYTLWSALVEGRTDGALVLIFRKMSTVGQNDQNEMTLVNAVLRTVHRHLSN